MKYGVELDKQHLERLGAATPLTAITELVWNAFDADADEVRVEFGRNDLDGIEEIRVRDDGHGMTHARAVEAFTKLGGSWKRTAEGSQTKNRALHGRDGRGRFRAIGVGRRIAWRTVAEDPDHPGRHMLTTIEIGTDDLSECDISSPEEKDERTGTTVILDGFHDPPKGLGGDGPRDRLTSTFALYLENYKPELMYDGDRIDPATMQTNRQEYALQVADGTATLTVVEWDRTMDRYMYLCDAAGTPLQFIQPGIQAPGFDFTVYVLWEGFAKDNELAVAELGAGDSQEVIEAARDQLREHFRERAAYRKREQIEKWKSEHTYPFEDEPTSEPERVARDVFDVVALSAAEVVNASEKKARRFSLRLLREALENDPGSLQHVLEEVLELPQERIDELSELLERTPLVSIIAASKEITGRLEFLAGLEELVLNRDISKLVKERSQLHRILAGQTWTFGEEYAVAADDESLTKVLKAHLHILGREELAEEEVLDNEGKRRIVDLMLARSMKQNRNRREHLVVELKAPSVAVGDDEAAQTRKYATAVASDARFDKTDVQWDFIVVSTQIRGSPELERHSENRPTGLIMDAGGVRVWAFTWGEIIDAAQHRLKFVQDLLGYSPDAQQAIEYLRKTHQKYLPSTLMEPSPSEAPQPNGSQATTAVE